MINKIYNSNDKEYISYGHYRFGNEDYYSLLQYKIEFLFKSSTREENQKDSNELKKYLGFSTYKTKPETGKDEFIMVYHIDLLNEYFNQ